MITNNITWDNILEGLRTVYFSRRTWKNDISDRIFNEESLKTIRYRFTNTNPKRGERWNFHDAINKNGQGTRRGPKQSGNIHLHCKSSIPRNRTPQIVHLEWLLTRLDKLKNKMLVVIFSRRRALRLLEVIFAHARVLSHSTNREKNEGLLVVYRNFSKLFPSFLILEYSVIPHFRIFRYSAF